MSPLQTLIICLCLLLKRSQSGVPNTWDKATGPNGEDIWFSTSWFRATNATSYGTIKVGQLMVMQFDWRFRTRVNTPTPGDKENYFRIGHTGSEGGCSEGTRYPSMWLTGGTTEDIGLLDISVTSGSQCDVSHVLTGYGNITRNDIWASAVITIDFNTITLNISGGNKSVYSESWQRAEITKKEDLGVEVPIWFGSDGGYNIGTPQFKDIRITSSLFTYAPTAIPTDAPTLPPTNVPSVHPSTSPTNVPSSDPTLPPSLPPTHNPTSVSPTMNPTSPPTNPSTQPSLNPTTSPLTQGPTTAPVPTTAAPTDSPITFAPTDNPFTVRPTVSPSYLEVWQASTTQVADDDAIGRNDDADQSGLSIPILDTTTLVMIAAVCVVGCCIVMGAVILQCKKKSDTTDDREEGSDYTATHTEMEIDGPEQREEMEPKHDRESSSVGTYTPDGVVIKHEHARYLSDAQKQELYLRMQGPRTDDPEECQRNDEEIESEPHADYLSPAQREELRKNGMNTQGRMDKDDSNHSSDDEVVTYMTAGMETELAEEWEEMPQPPPADMEHINMKNEGSERSDVPIEHRITIGMEDVSDASDEEQYDVQYDDEEEYEECISEQRIEDEDEYDNYETMQ